MKTIVLIVRIGLWVVASFFLIHLMGLVGLFVSAALPLWWLIAPHKTPCFFCNWKEEGQFCPVCRRKVENTTRYPKSFRSLVFNTAAVFIVFLISLAVLFVEMKVLNLFGYGLLKKNVSFVVPGEGQYRLGEIFPLEVDLTGVVNPINTVQADLSFDREALEVIDISTKGSFAKIFVDKEIKNDAGFARIAGGVANPGVICEDCHFASIYFKSKKPGITQVEYLPSSLVLANDGRGTNLVKSLGTVAFLILPEKINEEEERRQEVSLEANVLGVEIEKEDQLHLYQGKPLLETPVLGTETGKNKESLSAILSGFFLRSLQKFDSFVLNLWGGIFK